MHSGQLARLTGLSSDTLRPYERLGLLPPPQRTAGNYRDYPPTSQQRVELIQRTLTIGFSLTELKTILVVRDRAEHLVVTFASYCVLKSAPWNSRSVIWSQCALS